MNGLTTACLVAGIVSFLGFIGAVVFLPAQPPTTMFNELSHEGNDEVTTVGL
jgi:hypothetical protein